MQTFLQSEGTDVPGIARHEKSGGKSPGPGWRSKPPPALDLHSCKAAEARSNALSLFALCQLLAATVLYEEGQRGVSGLAGSQCLAYYA
eukprot:711136-Pelagomonas_calceolata.AAC.8